MNEQRIWSPEDRQQFGAEFSKEPIYLEHQKEQIEGWRNTLERFKFSWYDVQEELARTFISSLDYYNHQDPERARESIIKMDAFYRRIFTFIPLGKPERSGFPSYADYGIFRAGFMAEYATARALEDTGLKVYYPTQKDNHVYKVDWWLVPSEYKPEDNDYRKSSIWGIQVKNVGKRLDKLAFTVPGFDDDNYKLLVDKLKVDDDTKYKMLRNFEKQKLSMLKIRGALPVLFLIPSSQFDQMTGEPTQSMKQDIKELIEYSF